MLKWSDRNIIVTLVFVQFAICIFIPFLFPISLDEPFSIYHAQFPLNELLTEVQNGNNSPLHFVLLHFWIKLFGISPFAVRSLSLIFSLITVVYLYKIGRKFWNQTFAILPVMFFILSRLNHYVAVEARMYGLFTLFFTLILYDLHRLIFEDKRVFLRLGIWNALLLYTHYLGAMVVVMELFVFFCFFKQVTKPKLIQVMWTALIAGVLFIPGISVFFSRATDFSDTGSWIPDVRVADLWTNLVKLMNNQFALLGTLLLLIVFIVARRKNLHPLSKRVFTFFSISFLGSYALFYLFSITVQPIFFIKYLQFLSIPLFFCITAIWAKIDFGGKLKFFPFAILLPFLLSFKIIPAIDRNTDELVAYVKHINTPQTVVYYCPPHYSLTLAYHYSRSVFEDFRHTTEEMEQVGLISIYNHEGLDLGYQEVIFIDFDSKLLYPGNGILDTLNNHYLFKESRTFKGDFNVYKYAKN